MFADSRISYASKAVPPEPALVEVPSDGWKAQKLLASPCWSCEQLDTLSMHAAGEGQAFLVAQAAGGAGAASATRAAYGEIARLLQGQGLTIVHEHSSGA